MPDFGRLTIFLKKGVEAGQLGRFIHAYGIYEPY